MDTQRENGLAPTSESETWVAWPVSWSAIWVGTLSALAALTIFGLSGVVLKLHAVGTGHIDDWHKVSLGTVVCSILSSFFAFVIGAWVTGKIAGFRRSEPAMLHGAIVWLLSVPLLLAAVTVGGSNYMGSWYAGLGGRPVWASTTITTAAPVDSEAARQQEEQAARVARNGALAAVTALILGLVGGVLGGWMASGEPMTLTHHLHRQQRGGAMAPNASFDRGRVSV